MVWPIMRGESYVEEAGKSTKGVELELALFLEVVVAEPDLRSQICVVLEPC